jgi:hypothetical protein
VVDVGFAASQHGIHRVDLQPLLFIAEDQPMWHTPKGNRTLKGAEARLIREAIGCFADEIAEIDEAATVGVRLFDRLEWRQKIALLAEVAKALLDDAPPPKLTAINEATVAAIYRHIRISIEVEIDGDVPEDRDARFWRRLVLAAIREVDVGPPSPDSEVELPAENHDDLDEWHPIMDALESFVLHDDDWDMDDLFMDADPELSRARKDRLSIEDDYFTAIPPDPSDSEVDAARAVLRTLMTDDE